MTDLNQNFSLIVRNDTEVFFDLGPDESGINLEFVEALTWRAYNEVLGIPDMTMPLIEKGIGSGIEVTDPLLMEFTLTLVGSDTAGMTGNYYHQIDIVADHGALTTVATGLMTVIDPAVLPNVVAFKSMFPDFADIDDTLVQIALDTASQFVDVSWGDAQAPATMYLAAHFLASAHATADTDGRVVSSETIGRMSISYATGGASSQDALLGATRFGLVFEGMLTAQGYGIAIV